MEHTEKCRGCIIENRCDYITCRIDEAKEEMEKQLKKEKTFELVYNWWIKLFIIVCCCANFLTVFWYSLIR